MQEKTGRQAKPATEAFIAGKRAFVFPTGVDVAHIGWGHERHFNDICCKFNDICCKSVHHLIADIK